MFQRQILRSTRAASQRLPQSSRSSQPSSWSFSSLTSGSRSTRLSQPATISTQYLSRRWQSTEAQKTDDKSAAAADGAANPAESSQDSVLKQEIEKKNKEIIEIKDKYLRSVADYRNLQDRTTRDQTSARNFAIQKFATDLLDSIDNLDRALSAVPDAALGKSSSSSSSSSSPTTVSNTSSADPNVGAAAKSTSAPTGTTSSSPPPNKDLQNLHSGLRMTEQIMMQTLKKHGLERFDPLDRAGHKFDPNLDEATFFTKVEGKNDGEVFYTQSKGYTLNGRVIRASKVGVVKNS